MRLLTKSLSIIAVKEEMKEVNKMSIEKYECNHCGYLFDISDAATRREAVAPYGEGIAYDYFDVCPRCGDGNLSTVEVCDICGDIVAYGDLDGGVCENCMQTMRYDTKLCLKYGRRNKEIVALNSFLLYMFDANDIEQLLTNALNDTIKQFGDIDCADYISSYDDFPDFFKEEETKR